MPGEALVLQLWVSTERNNHVMFGTGERVAGMPNSTINRHSTDQGPIAFEPIWRGEGWRAALEASAIDALRLVGGIAGAIVAIGLHPPIARIIRRAMRRTATTVLTAVTSARRVLSRLASAPKTQALDLGARSKRSALYVYPWLIPAFAILHYLANNLLHFNGSDAVLLSVVVMAATTGLYVISRSFLRNASASLFVGVLGLAFFSYGHVFEGYGNDADDRFLLGGGLPAVLALGLLLRTSPGFAHHVGRIANPISIVLIALPLYQIAAISFSQAASPTHALSKDFPGITERIDEVNGLSSSIHRPERMRDIYYIILDAYPRHGSPQSFDNSTFVQDLKTRGFYVDPYARSNYPGSVWSILSSLDMIYVEEFPRDDPGILHHYSIEYNNHNLGRIFKALGYLYVQLSSGYTLTHMNRNADLVIEFTPSGPKRQDPIAAERIARLQHRFTYSFLETTAAKRFISKEILSFAYRDQDAYSFEHPRQALGWLDFMKSEVAEIEEPKFVFTHLLKPHGPYSFDRHGNITFDIDGWSDDHDPSVSSAFYGQIIWLNERILEVIDAILAKYDEPPIIVIAGDHGAEYEDRSRWIRHDILAAYLLPDGGDTAIYPSITSVNVFRAILNHYFGLNLELLEDITYRI